MAVTQNDIKFYKSAASGSAGGARTANEVTSALGNLFEAISDAERSAGGSKTKKWFLANISASESWSNPVVWIDTVPTNCTEQIGYGWDDSEDDDATQGNMVAWDQSQTATVQSDGADTRQVQVVGKNSATGVGATETLTLNGTNVVTGTISWAAVYSIRVSAVDAARTVTLKRTGSATVRGTIGPNYKTAWLWLSPTSKANGIFTITLTAGAEHGFWDKIAWTAAAGAVDPNTSVIAAESA